MRHLFLLLLLAFGPAGPAHAQETPLVTLDTRDDSRGWEGVGRLDIDGKGFCTAALIDVRLILTAAHCVYDDDGEMIDASRFLFNAGLRNGRALATRGVRRLVAHPDYHTDIGGPRNSTVAVDIAVLELDQPIRQMGILPFPIAERPRPGEAVGVVSYARGRTDAASLQEVCSVVQQQEGVVVMTCDVDFGASGSPVFMIKDGKRNIVSVISAMGQLGAAKVALGTSLDAPLRALIAHFNGIGPAQPGGNQRMILSGQRNNTGAKFVRPGG